MTSELPGNDGCQGQEKLPIDIRSSGNFYMIFNQDKDRGNHEMNS
jgi:hypothetical protein